MELCSIKTITLGNSKSFYESWYSTSDVFAKQEQHSFFLAHAFKDTLESDFAQPTAHVLDLENFEGSIKSVHLI